MISLITAMDRNRNIGLNGNMPWGKEMKADLRRFKELTDGKHIVMGRKTFESLPGSLPNRQCHVLSREKLMMGNKYGPWMNPNWHPHTSIESVLEATKGEELWVIGGAQIYEQFLPYADKIYVTKVLAHLEGDTKFPAITGAWDIEQGMLHHLDGDKYGSQYVTYTRRKQNES